MEDEFKLEFLAWMLDPPRSDKIWGWLTINKERCYCFWGPRGVEKNLVITFKQYNKNNDFVYDRQDALKDGKRKVAKGYKQVNTSQVDGVYHAAESIYPGFSEHLKNQLMLARLCGKVKREEI